MTPIDPEVQKYFEEYIEMFGTPGWKRFITDLEGSLKTDQKTAAKRCDTTEKWFEERGAQAKTERMVQFETMIRNNYDQLQLEATEGDSSYED